MGTINERVSFIKWVLEALVDGGVGKTSIKILFYLIDTAVVKDEKVYSYVTYKELAKKFGVSPQAIFAAMSKLRKSGLVGNRGHGKFEIYL